MVNGEISASPLSPSFLIDFAYCIFLIVINTLTTKNDCNQKHYNKALYLNHLPKIN
uniref:Uncharacterized protein n=1 Tax=Podoviridae sp. ctwV53 TaxID=2826587 RepID=A0A8S5MSF0_9CAUD|nr:MAG TPA: hypothetical protein [Podoviridae sp. ctwV53]